MNNFKKFEWTISILSFILILLTIITIILEQNKSNWICGSVLIFMQLILIPVQIILNIIVVKSKKERLKIILCIISLVLITFIAVNFIRFLTNCS